MPHQPTSPRRWARALAALIVACLVPCLATVRADAATARYAPTGSHTAPRCVSADTTQAEVRLDNRRSTRAVTFELIRNDSGRVSYRYVTVAAGSLATRIVRANYGHRQTVTLRAFDAQVYRWTLTGRYCAQTATLVRKSVTTYAVKVTNRRAYPANVEVYTDAGPDVRIHYVHVPGYSTRTYLDGVPRTGVRVEAWIGEHRLLARSLTR